MPYLNPKKCEVCGNSQFTKYKIKNTLFCCKKCGVLFSRDTKFKHNFTSDVNPASMERSLEKLRMQNYEKIITVIEKYFQSKKVKGLEVGSSYGWFLETSKKHKIICDGIEPEEKTYNISLGKNHSVTRGFFPQDIRQKVKYDFIIFNDTLEHIPDLKSCLKATREFLKNDGLLIVNMPLSTGVFYKSARFLSFLGINKYLNRLWQFDFHSPHYYYFNKSNFTQMLKNYDYDIYQYMRLKTLLKDDIKERLMIDKKIKNRSALLEKIIALMIPSLAILPEDIGCFFAIKKG